MFPILLGLYLTVHFAHLIPYAPELFSSRGVLADPALNPTYPLFPNLLNVAPFSSAGGATAFLVFLTVLAMCFAAGIQRRWVAIALWYGWAALFNRNNLIANPGIPYIGWLLLATALVPEGEGLGRQQRKNDWRLPPAIFFSAWVLLGLGYTVSGIAKLKSPSWVDGSAFILLLDNPLARDTWLRELFHSLPTPVLKLHTWIALFFEVAFFPLCLFLRTRFVAWAALLGMHLGILCFISFADLTAGMLLVHLFTFDPRWLPAKKGDDLPIVFFDGVCGLCNQFIDFLLSEDHREIFRVAALQGSTAQAAKLTPQDGGDFRSVVLQDGDGTHRGAQAVLRIFSRLGGMWRVLSVARWLPARPLDTLYAFVAARRYRWFGKKETCRLPSPEERARFLP